MRKAITIILGLLLGLHTAEGQKQISIEGQEKWMVGVSDYKGEKIAHITLPTYYVYAPLIFKNNRQQRYYTRLVRDVKKTIPLAIEIRGIIHETEAHLKTLTDKKEQKRYIDLKEKELKELYTPKMKKLTLRQGKLLIKLIDRECDQNAYQLIKLFMGSFKAVFYQSFASLFGASLKKTYDPTGEDFLIERVVTLVVSGQL